MTRADQLAPLLTTTALALRDAFDEGSPAVIRSTAPLFETREVFEWIKRAHPPAKAGSSLAKLHAVKRSWGLDVEPEPEDGSPQPGRAAEVYVRGAMVLEPAPFLPREDQADFATWIRETHDLLGDAFGMQAPGIECASVEALGRLQALLAPTLARTGPRTYRYNAFVGDYPRTPFGFHVDPHQEAVFQYVVEGRRKAHFWEGLTLQDRDAAWLEDANGLTTPRIAPDVSFELEPGDIVFWPGTHVHGLEPEGPSMALSMVIDRAAPLTRAQVVTNLEIETMGGQAALPAPQDAGALGPGTSLLRRSCFPIAHARWEDALIIGVCGRTFDWPEPESEAAALRLFAQLNTLDVYARIEASALVESCADETLAAPDILELLSALISLGFLATPD